MPTDHRALASDYASTAEQVIQAANLTSQNAVQVAIAEALLAIYHQLRAFDDTPPWPHPDAGS